MQQILLDNAYVSWRNAIDNHDRIMQGFASLHHQKAFVSSLHNAIELFFKQIMLDSNNHEVASLRKIKDEHDDQLALQYYQSSNLNYYNSKMNTNRRS